MNRYIAKIVKNKAVYILSLVFVLVAVLTCAAGVYGENVYAKDGNGDIVIVIDPGHGGYDGGAISASTGDRESDLNWNIAKYMKAELETYAGVRVYVTRANNEWNSNTGRSQFVKVVGADAIISIHNNSAANESASGFVAYGSVSTDYVEVTKNLCLNMARHAQAAGLNLYNNGYLTRSSGYDAGVDYYTVIDEGIRAGIPTIIVEHCFLSNSSNAAFIHEAANQKKVGVTNATAVAEFFGLSKRTVSDGQSVTLDRSYSAYFIPANQRDGAITFTSSDENVAYVRSDGLITAVNAGTATITYTFQDGTSGSCTFTTKEVTQVGVSAGINPTVYHSSEQVAAIDKSKIMVKAIYSDGTCRQQSSGYVIGDIDPNLSGRQYISVSHNGFGSTFSITLDPSKDAGNYKEYLYQVHGDYTDIFTLPELVSVEGVTGSPYTSNGFEDRPVSDETTAQDEQQTEAQTTAESTEQTTAETTAENTEQATEQSTAESTAESTQQTTEEKAAESTQQSTEESASESMQQTEEESTAESTQQTTEETTAESTKQTTEETTVESTAASTEVTTSTKEGNTTVGTTENIEADGHTTEITTVVLILLIVLLIILCIAIAVLLTIRNKGRKASMKQKGQGSPKRRKKR